MLRGLNEAILVELSERNLGEINKEIPAEIAKSLEIWNNLKRSLLWISWRSHWINLRRDSCRTISEEIIEGFPRRINIGILGKILKESLNKFLKKYQEESLNNRERNLWRNNYSNAQRDVWKILEVMKVRKKKVFIVWNKLTNLCYLNDGGVEVDVPPTIKIS